MPIKRRREEEKEEGFKLVINIPASVIRYMTDHLLDTLSDELVTDGSPQGAADLKIFILEKAIDRLEKEELEKNDN